MQVLKDPTFLPVLYGMVGITFLVISFIVIYVRNQRSLFRQQAAFKEAELVHQKALLHAIIQSQETEQRRIGRDLHDDVGTALSRLRMNIESAAGEEAMTPRQVKLYDSSKQIIDQVMGDIRNIAHRLSPAVLNLYGLTEALDELADMIKQTASFHLDLSNDAEEAVGRLSPEVCLALYRVIQELLTNTQKHAQASTVAISLTKIGGTLQIAYSDNGRGMAAATTASRGMGLQNIESRLGMIQARYQIRSSEGDGFSITIQLDMTYEPGY